MLVYVLLGLTRMLDDTVRDADWIAEDDTNIIALVHDRQG